MRIIRSRKGMTMIEVMVAFVVLTLIMGIFSQALALAGRMVKQTGKALEISREMVGDYYLDQDFEEVTEVGTELSFRLSENSELENLPLFFIPARLRRFTKGESVIYDVEVP